MSGLASIVRRADGSRHLVRGFVAFVTTFVAVSIAWIADLVWQDLNEVPSMPLAWATLVITMGLVPFFALWLRGSGFAGSTLGAIFGLGIALSNYVGVARVIDPGAQPIDPGAIEGLNLAIGALLGAFIVPAGLVAWGVGAIVRRMWRHRHPGKGRPGVA